MPNPSTEKDSGDFDSPWKEAIQQFLRDFLAYCFPQAEAGIDWAREPEFLEQELRALVPEAEVGRQQVDQLVRVWRLDGGEQWVLLHVEVQSQRDSALEKRLFQYHYRLVDRYDVPVATFCLLSDAAPGFRPSAFEQELWNCGVRFWFPTCKLLDFKEAELRASMNPIALVIRAHLAALERRRLGDRELYRIRKEIFLDSYERGLPIKGLRKLLHVVSWLTKLPRPLELEFRRDIRETTEEKRMPYVNIFEEVAREEALEEGRTTLRQLILQSVKRHFSAVPEGLSERLKLVSDSRQLQEIVNLSWDVATLEEFEARLDELGI
jgi:hypothetical protein